MRRRSFLLAPVLLLAGPARAAPRVTAVPGGVARLRLGTSEQPPKAFLEGHRLMVRRERGDWVALAGVALSARAGSTLRVEVVRPDGQRDERPITVVRKKYLTQALTVPPEQAELAPDQVQRYEAERAHLREVLATFTESVVPGLALRQPVPGIRSASFGLRRVINGVERNPHGGMDIAAPIGMRVGATAAGKVLDAGEYLFLGNTLVLDHGQGLLSLYAHLNAFHSALGDTVPAGATIAEVGATGRVTGPHLHFSVYLNTVAVDPAIFLPAEKPA